MYNIKTSKHVLQVINAALALAAKPQSKLAQENMDLFKEQWEKQVRVLTDAVDDITSIDDFLAVSGNKSSNIIQRDHQLSFGLNFKNDNYSCISETLFFAAFCRCKVSVKLWFILVHKDESIVVCMKTKWDLDTARTRYGSVVKNQIRQFSFGGTTGYIKRIEKYIYCQFAKTAV